MEAKYIVKIITGDLRIGLKEGLLEDAVAQAFERTPAEVRSANLLLGNIAETAVLARAGALDQASLTPFQPFKFMLASPEETAQGVWNRMEAARQKQTKTGKVESSAREVDVANPPDPAPAEMQLSVWIEDKYDGIRCQLHKVGDRVALYSRDLKEITVTFHDIAEGVRGMISDFILDGEIVAMREGVVLPFSDLQRRLGRREADLFMREEMPVKFVAFDLVWHSGETLLNEPLSIRRSRLENIAQAEGPVVPAKISEARSPSQIEEIFNAARQRGNEGLMIKDPRGSYAPGRRGLSWLKLKKPLATLDCVVVGAEYGHGKRSKVLSDYTFAVRDELSGELRVIGKAFTGLTDVEIQQLTEHFLRTATRQHGRFFAVRPEIVLEIAFDRLQPSSRHNSGLAMRFPRIVRIRTDKPVGEIDTLATARRIAGQ
jgi:DNA ligase-1